MTQPARVDETTRRSDRRLRTREAILEAARRLFAENGYAKATIRAVAARAACDPALVMQHFGNKQALFREATMLDLDVAAAYAGPLAGRTARVLRHIFERMDAHPHHIASTLRSMLTHDDVAEDALKLFNAPSTADVANASGDPDAALRRDLLMSFALGTAITRYVLKADAVEQASLDDLLTCLIPAATFLERPSFETPAHNTNMLAPGDSGERH